MEGRRADTLMDRPLEALDSAKKQLESEWGAACESFLPAHEEGSFWRFNVLPPPGFPSQGWKLHVSATLPDAPECLRRVGPLLQESRRVFKGPATLVNLTMLNMGFGAFYSQIGKCLTVYVADADIRSLAHALDQATLGLRGPEVLSEPAVRPGSLVSYRYGCYGDAGEIEAPDGTRIRDERQFEAAVPTWLDDPFPRSDNLQLGISTDPYYVYEVISSRGKGSVYRALDLGVVPARRCILKEGRRNGEVNWVGRDGRDLVAREAELLPILKAQGVPVPALYGAVDLEAAGIFIAFEEIDGPSLRSEIQEAPIPELDLRLQIAREIADAVRLCHAAGYAWRDCKPANVLIDKASSKIRLVDFESACNLEDMSAEPIGTEGYLPRGWAEQSGSWAANDVYALGITILDVLTWRFVALDGPPTDRAHKAIRELRMEPRVAVHLLDLLEKAIGGDGKDRPGVADLAAALAEV